MIRKTIYIFPGQASQYVGMGLDLYRNSAASRQVMERITAMQGLEHISSLSFEGPEELLTRTNNVQPAITAVSLMALAAIREYYASQPELIQPIACAGHSLGEYSAHVAAGSLSESLAIELVTWRGRWMNEAAQPPYPEGAMVAVMGLGLESLQDIVRSIGAGMLAVANLNSPGQVILSGEKKCIDEAIVKAKAAGAKRTIILNVSGAWHSPLMTPAARKMGKLLSEKIQTESTSINRDISVIANVSAEPVRDVDHLRETLTAQVISPVKWEASVYKLIELAGSSNPLFVEIGPGKVLKGLLRNIDKKLNVVNVENWSDVEGLGDKLAVSE